MYFHSGILWYAVGNIVRQWWRMFICQSTEGLKQSSVDPINYPLRSTESLTVPTCLHSCEVFCLCPWPMMIAYKYGITVWSTEENFAAYWGLPPSVGLHAQPAWVLATVLIVTCFAGKPCTVCGWTTATVHCPGRCPTLMIYPSTCVCDACKSVESRWVIYIERAYWVIISHVLHYSCSLSVGLCLLCHHHTRHLTHLASSSPHVFISAAMASVAEM